MSVARVAELLNDRIAGLAVELLGTPNRALSSAQQLRFGTKGSIAVEIAGNDAGRWYDHEAGTGGAGPELIRHHFGMDEKAAWDWARHWLGDAAMPASWTAAKPATTKPAKAPASGPARTVELSEAELAAKVAEIVRQREAAYLICDVCGGVHHEHDKPRLLVAGEWRPTAPGDGRTAGFHLSSLYSPWETWIEIAQEHARVAKDPARLQVWVNTKLGESWEDQAGDTVPADPLMARREDWGNDLAPGVTVLTAGVDVQGDRIEVQIVGWGRDEEAWVIDYRVLWGDPSGPRLWSDLDGVLNGTWGDLPVRAVAVDTGGHHTKMAYEFCLARRVWAIKGRGGPGIPVWPRRPTRSNKAKIPLFIVGVDAVKDAVYAGLKLTEPGHGAIHFPRRLDADYFRQLTAERVVTRFEKGRPIRSWQPKRDGERNEALDTFVYAHAALHGLISMGMRLNEEVEAHAGRVTASNRNIIRSQWVQR